MLHAHPMVHGSLFTDTSIVQLLIDALSQNDVENTSECADVTPLTVAEFNKTCTSPTTKLWLM